MSMPVGPRGGWKPLAYRAGPIVAFLLLLPSPLAQANPLAPIWTGVYGGVHGGAAWSDVEVTGLSSLDASRAAFGGHIGYNLGLGGLIVGVEADATYLGSRLSFTTAGGGVLDVESDWSGSIRGRLGVALGPALLYATAGWAWSGVTLAERTGGATTGTSSATLDGVVYGLGAEAFVLPGVSMRLEALRYDWGTERLSLDGGIGALRDLDRGDTVVRAGVTLHLR